MKKALLLTVLFAMIALAGFSQADRFWSANSENPASFTKDKAALRLSFPTTFKLFNLDIEALRRELFTIVGEHAARHSTIISLPNADGNIEQFEVYEASNFEPALQARFPQIRAFSGRGITDKGSTLKLSISPQGIQTMLFRIEKQNEFIEAYSADHAVYAVFRSSRGKEKLPWVCSTPEKDMANGIDSKVNASGLTGSSAGELRVIRLAQSCTGEYANFFGASTAGNAADQVIVLTAYNNTLTRCNGCYEKDLALHLNLIAATTSVIFYNPATDPYATVTNPNSPPASWNSSLQTTLTNIIGEANYDIGHLFGASGGGGNAGCIGCVCVNGQKGSGITSPATGSVNPDPLHPPAGDDFDIDYVVHEVGHQLGATHTFTFSSEGGPLASSSQREPGSGITIMGYAGITNQDDSMHSIAFYHEISIEQIQNNLATKSCPVTTSITANNATPVVAPVSNYTIPITTPFALTGSATDANPADVLTYQWEQIDPSTSLTGNNSVAYPTKASGPNWVSFNPTLSSTRLCPRLSTILAGLAVTPTLGGDAVANVEALSSVSRTLNFRLTVRDNHPYVSDPPALRAVGQTAYTDMTVTVTNTAGPFKVTSPNTNVSWAGGSSQTITWDVLNTNAAPINCANVKISLSTDGGTTFPTVLAASTPNDGSELLTIPNTPTTTARIKIEAIGNIFFDIDDANFTITAASNPTFTFVPPTNSSVSCGTASAAITLSTTSTLGFVTPINLVATGNPGGTNVTYSVNPVIPGNSTVVTLNGMNTLAPGSYPVTITGTAGAEIKSVILTYVVNPGAGPAITAQPAPQTVCAGSNTSFSITSASATTFQWQVSTDGGGTWSNVSNGGVYSGATSATLNLTGVTAVLNNYQYRCVAGVLCGTTNSNGALLVVNAAPSFSAQPANSITCSALNTTFSVTATGALTYQWQVSLTGCAGTFNNLANGAPYSGVLTNTLTITGATTGMNGYAYRCVVSGTCAPAATSNCGLLTVNTPVAVTAQPSASVICAGSTTSFTTAASGTTPAYQWQESTNGGGTWNNISNGGIYSGATTVTLTLTGVTAGMNNNQYRCVVSGAAPCGTANSNAAVLTVNTAPAITGNPVLSTTLCVGGNTNYSVVANGTALTYQWQVSTDGGTTYNNLANGGVYTNVTTATLTISGATAAMNNYRYRCVIGGTCAPAATSAAGTLVVNTPASVTNPTSTPPGNTICATGTITFSVAGSGTLPATPYQWQESTNGGVTWTNVVNGGVYSGAATATITLTNVTAGMNNNQYRCVVTGTAPCGSVNSGAAVLTVSAQPVVTLSAAPYTKLKPGLPSPGNMVTTTITASVTPAVGFTTVWSWNGTPITPTGNSYVVDLNHLGVYTVVATIGSCTSVPATITIADSASSTLFIYPSPNDGLFTISYYSPGASITSQTVQYITIYDSYGRRVMNDVYTVTQPYQLHKIDMRRQGAGVYYVVLREANGNKIRTGEVVIR